MAVIAVAFAAGVLAAAYVEPVLWGGAIALAVIVAGAVGGSRLRTAALVAGAMFVLGAARYCVGREVPVDDISRFRGWVTAFEGVVASDPDIRRDQVRIVVRTDRVNASGEWRPATGCVMTNIYLRRNDSAPALDYGDRLRIHAFPYSPREPTNPGKFSWKGYLARQGIYACASVRRPDAIEILPGRTGNPLIGAALGAKHYVARSIQRIHPSREASVVLGMVLGTYAYLPRETFKNFTDTGTLHLLAASGYNCFILLALATPIFMCLHVAPKWRNIAVAGLVVMYVLMVGAKPSLVRAAVMSGLWLMAIPLNRTPNIRNLFFAAGLIVLMMNPSDLFDVGFQLSFAAVWALITASEIITSIIFVFRWRRRSFKRREWPLPPWASTLTKPLWEAAIATVTVTLFTAPIVAYYFNYISLVALPANLALALGVPIVFAVGLVSPVVAYIPGVGTAVGWIGTKVTDAMLWVVNQLGSSEHSTLTVASPGIFAIIGYYIVLHAALSYARSRYA
ncbi:MAG: ComEC family competence protein [Armatimonadetes bacterium]|nr:ComEC family competence protein [Armatimonadota bacterium]